MMLTPKWLQRTAEAGLETVLELLPREDVVLGAVLLDLDRTHQARDAAGRFPTELVQQPIHEPRPVSVPAPGRVLDRSRLHDRNLVLGARSVDRRALGAARHDQRVDPG